MSQYSQNIVVGKIHSVSVKNFVTYNEITLYAGEYLNVILGPNGTGKSTIVAAIVLGMGGNPKLLLRSPNIIDYIKNRKDSAWIQIQIYKNIEKETISFERFITHDGKSKWTVNGTQYNEKQYLKEVAKFNIQVSNLCQFLPQDRVQDFAKMNPQEILINTQNSVCSQDIINTFNELKELRKTQLTSQTSINDYKKELTEAEQRQETLKHAVEIIKERRSLVNKIEIFLNKKSWLECEEFKNELNNIKNDLDQQEKFVKRDSKSFDNLKKKVKSILDAVDKIETDKKKEEEESKKSYTQLNKLKDNYRRLQSDIKLAKSDLKSKLQDENERDSNLKNAHCILQAYAQDLKNQQQICGNQEQENEQRRNFSMQLENIQAEKEKLTDDCRKINRLIDDNYQPRLIYLKKKISELESIPMRKLNMLRNSFEDVHKAILWVRQNRHIFEGHIYEPMLLELNIKDAENAKYLENSVSTRDLIAFICVCKNDVDLLTKKLCNEQNLRVNIIYSKQTDTCLYKPTESINAYKKYGFHSYLFDMIEGPAPLLNYLCQAYNLHKIMIGSNEIDNHADNLPNHIRSFFGGNYRYSTTISKYSKAKSTLREEISSRQNLFCMYVDINELNQFKKELKDITAKSDALKNQRTAIESKMLEYDEKRKEVLQNKKEFEKKLFDLQHCKNKLQMQLSKIKSIQENAINIEEEEKKYKELVQEKLKRMVQIHLNELTCLQNCQKHDEKVVYYSTKLNIHRNENSSIDRDIINAKNALINSQETYETIRAKYEKYKSCYKEKLKEVREKFHGKLPNEDDFPCRRDYSKVPNNIEQIDEKVSEFQSKLDCMSKENQNVLKEYEEIKTKIKKLNELITKTNTDENVVENRIKVLHDKWYPEIIKILEIINDNFTKFMSSMGYAGEIQLQQNNERDYDDYGVKILVKYKDNSKLQALDRYVQSGGERAVAIAIYTLSLQHITNVPFRCVDEINQGMDVINERKIFNMIVEETSQPGRAQYFFVTPKFPSGLNYNENMEVHVIFSGKYLQNSNVFNQSFQ